MKNSCSSALFLALLSDQKQLRAERIYFTLQLLGYSPSPGKVRAGTRRQSPSQHHKGALMLASSPALASLDHPGPPPQDWALLSLSVFIRTSQGWQDRQSSGLEHLLLLPWTHCNSHDPHDGSSPSIRNSSSKGFIIICLPQVLGTHMIHIYADKIHISLWNEFLKENAPQTHLQINVMETFSQFMFSSKMTVAYVKVTKKKKMDGCRGSVHLILYSCYFHFTP